jgi:hypothetical protein
MAHDIFISYSSKDKPIADATCAALEAKGLRCWIAPRDIVPGADWGESIIDGIGASKAFVLLLSANANLSPQIKREVERAVHAGLSIITMRIEDVQPSKSLQYFLSTPHWLDAMSPPLERHLTYLADVLRHILEDQPAPVPLPKPAPRPGWLMDRRVLIGGGAAVLGALGFGLWRATSGGGDTGAQPSSVTAGSFVGKWKAEKITLSAGTLQANSIPFATDIFVAAALEGGALNGTFEVDALGQYVYHVTAEDGGAVVVSGDKVTFTPDTTHKAHTFGFYRIKEEMAILMVNAYGGEEGDQGLVFNPSPPFQQASMVGKPRGDGIGGVWRFKNQVNGLVHTPQVTLNIGDDGRYSFRADLDEKGLWVAADGKWTRTPQAVADRVEGTYAFDGPDRVTCAAANGTTVWVRTE